VSRGGQSTKLLCLYLSGCRWELYSSDCTSNQP